MSNDKPFNEEDEEQFSKDPEENMRIENEILRIKVKAELGGAYEGSENLPPEIENEFLKNILAFEHQYANTKMIKIIDLLSNPKIKNEAELSDEMIIVELQIVEELLEQKSIVVDFIKDREARFKYKFITEELLHYDTDDMQVEGMTKHFTYEEFYPDHEAEIKEHTLNFLSDWFERKIDTANWYLGEQFIQPDGKILSRSQLAEKLAIVFAAYTAFDDCQYALGNIEFDLKESNDGTNEGMGFAEGVVKYIAILENGEQQPIEGPFKFYFSREYGSWHIFFFYLTGFNS